MNNETCVFIGLGSNLGNGEKLLKAAICELAQVNGVQLVAISSLFRTEPQGDKEQPWFCNQVARINCTLSPLELLRKLQLIENSLGRVRTERRFGPRSIDLDILVFGDIIMNTPELSIPHPRMQERAFVLVPLAELEPTLMLMLGTKIGSVKSIGSVLGNLNYTLSGDKIYQNL